MKIAMFGHKTVPSRLGGVELVVTELSRRMAARGHSVICYNRGGKAGSFEGVRVKPVPTLPGKGLAAASSSVFAALAAAFSDARVVHIHAEGPALMSWLPKLLGKRVVVTVHGLDWQRQKWQNSLGKWYILAGERAAVRFADEIIVLSRNHRRYFRETYGRETVLIPNGVGDGEIRPPEQIFRFGLRGQDYILFLGRLVPEKEIHTLIEAYLGLDTKKKLVIAGESSDTEDYVSRLKNLAREDGRIVFTGFAEGRLLQELYSNACLYVLPSRVEGMPLSLLEAMCCGTCCLVSDIPELTEVAEGWGAVFPCGDVLALREALQDLLEDPDRLEALGQKARCHVQRNYRWDAVVERTLELYR